MNLGSLLAELKAKKLAQEALELKTIGHDIDRPKTANQVAFNSITSGPAASGQEDRRDQFKNNKDGTFERKESAFNSITSQLYRSDTSSKKMTLAQRIAGHSLKKSLRAQQSHLRKERHQLEAIQIDLGLDLMTGTLLRDKVPHEFNSFKAFESTVNLLVQYKKP